MKTIEYWMVEDNYYIGGWHPKHKKYIVGEVEGKPIKARLMKSQKENLVKLKVGRIRSSWFVLGNPQPYNGNTEWI